MNKTDLQIANESELLPIANIAKKLKIKESQIHSYGNYIAKLPLSVVDEKKIRNKKLVLVTAMTPTPSGEGKTTTSIGLSDGLNKLGVKSTVVLREPSLGPVFGVKGGATGGGYSQVLPMEDINLHFTGDMSAIEKAHNLLAAIIDNHLHNRSNTLNLDPRKIVWKRVMDMNDRSLRDIITGLGGPKQGIPRQTGFNITAASEVMAALCLAESLDDLKEKLGNILIGYTFDDEPVFASDLNAQGAMTALLKYAVMPNLVQTLEGNPAIIHGGPFANIAQGTNSLIATKLALSKSEYVVTEAGFASELGAEKFFNIKSQYGNLNPSVTVIVATVRALKYHGGSSLKNISEPDLTAVENGLQNLFKHIENVRHFNLEPIIALNRFKTDTDTELNFVINQCKQAGVKASIAEGWEKGSQGVIELSEMVKSAAENCKTCFKPLYDFNWDIEKKLHTIATKLYGADHVEYTVKAKRQIALFEQIGIDKLPLCVAKTQKSLSDNPSNLGRPRGFIVKIREFDVAAGAGFLIPIAGDMMRMPGLPVLPSAEKIDIDNDGNIKGLF